MYGEGYKKANNNNHHEGGRTKGRPNRSRDNDWLYLLLLLLVLHTAQWFCLHTSRTRLFNSSLAAIVIDSDNGGRLFFIIYPCLWKDMVVVAVDGGGRCHDNGGGRFT